MSALRTTAICLGLPLVVGLIGLVVALAIAGDLPDRVALHAGTGPIRGWTSQDSAPLYVLAAPAAGVVVAALALAALRRPRLAAALGTAVAALGACVILGMLWEQRGLADPRRSPGASGASIALGVVLAVLLGTAAAAAARRRAV